MGTDPTTRPPDPRVETMARALGDLILRGTTGDAERVLAALDASDLIVCTVPQLRAAVEAHHEWAYARLGDHLERDCGTDVAARLRARREAQGGG